MRVELIHPPIYVNPRSIQALCPSLPLGLAYIAGVLLDDGHHVRVLDAVATKPTQINKDGSLHYFGLTPAEIVDAIDPKAEIIGISVLFSFAWPLVKRIIQSITTCYPEKIVVAGGEHCTGLPEYSLKSVPIDYIVLGEGEQTVRELFHALETDSPTPADIPGLAYLDHGNMVKTAPRKRILDVDALPWPAWNLFDPKAYYEYGFVMGFDVGMTMPILATRGCPYSCKFCSSPMMWGQHWIPRDPVKVVDEIEYYHEHYGAINISFHDLTAILKKSWIVTLCEELVYRDLKISWQLTAGTRCEAIDEEVAKLMRRSGGTSFGLAPESGSDRTRKLIGKKLDDANLMKAIKASVQNGINVCTFYVIGFPHDTLVDLWASVKLAFRLAVAGVNDIALNCYFPIPGTQIYHDLIASGRIMTSDKILMTPLFAMELSIKEENSYCEALSARMLTVMKYVILLTFYITSFIVRPWRAFQIVWNVICSREHCKLDTFLIQRKRRILRWFGV